MRQYNYDIISEQLLYHHGTPFNRSHHGHDGAHFSFNIQNYFSRRSGAETTTHSGQRHTSHVLKYLLKSKHKHNSANV